MHPRRTRDAALAALRSGVSLSEAGRRYGVHRSTLRSWRADPGARAPDDGCFPCTGSLDDEQAYAALLGFYLGDGCLSERPRYTALRVSCDARLPGIVHDVADAIVKVRPGIRVFQVRAPGTMVVQAHWQHWTCLFPQHGPGRKHERPIVLEDWQQELVTRHPGAFLRGLFHSDGSRTRNWATRVVGGTRKRYDYPRWEFVNRSDDILGLCCWALDLSAIPWRRPRVNAVAVSRREAVRRLDELIGPKA